MSSLVQVNLDVVPSTTVTKAANNVAALGMKAAANNAHMNIAPTAKPSTLFAYKLVTSLNRDGVAPSSKDSYEGHLSQALAQEAKFPREKVENVMRAAGLRIPKPVPGAQANPALKDENEFDLNGPDNHKTPAPRLG